MSTIIRGIIHNPSGEVSWLKVPRAMIGLRIWGQVPEGKMSGAGTLSEHQLRPAQVQVSESNRMHMRSFGCTTCRWCISLIDQVRLCRLVCMLCSTCEIATPTTNIEHASVLPTQHGFIPSRRGKLLKAQRQSGGTHWCANNICRLRMY